MGGRWPYSGCFVGCCFQDLFNVVHSILVQLLSNLFSICFVSVHVMHPYSRIDTTVAWKKLRFILSDSSDIHMIDKLSIAVHTFAYWCLSLPLSILSSTDSFVVSQPFSKARHARRSKLWSKPDWLYTCRISHCRTIIILWNIYIYIYIYIYISVSYRQRSYRYCCMYTLLGR